MLRIKENIDKIIFGGIYKCKNRFPCEKYGDHLNDQKYYIWVPIYYKYTNSNDEVHEGYGMIDTYQIDYDISYANDKNIDYTNMTKLEIITANLTELSKPEKGNWARRKTFDYYYKAFCELTDYNFNDFELVADLKEYKQTSNPEYYNKEDTITNLKLYREHAYPYGIDILKKSAEVNYKYKISNKIYENRSGYGFKIPDSLNDGYINELLILEKEAIEKNQEYDKKQLDIFIEENKFLAKQREEYNNFMKDLEKVSEGDNE